MKELTQTEHRSRMVLGVKLVCSQCQNRPAVDSCNQEECPFHFWINTLHRQRMFDVSDLAADVCRYCYGKCGYWYPTCQNRTNSASGCILFNGKESAVVCSGSKSGLSEPANPVNHVWKDVQCQK